MGSVIKLHRRAIVAGNLVKFRGLIEIELIELVQYELHLVIYNIHHLVY